MKILLWYSAYLIYLCKLYRNYSPVCQRNKPADMNFIFAQRREENEISWGEKKQFGISNSRNFFCQLSHTELQHINSFTLLFIKDFQNGENDMIFEIFKRKKKQTTQNVINFLFSLKQESLKCFHETIYSRFLHFWSQYVSPC